MVPRLGSLLIVVVALAIVPSAFAAFPGPMAVQGGKGLANFDKSLHFVAVKAGADTKIAAVDADGTTVMSRTVSGSFGTVVLTPNGLGGGLFQDGSAFVLQNVGLKSTSSFMIVGASDLATRNTITLKGTFGFDALSPDASKLYLIQHTSIQDIQHYIVRAYDLNANKLLPGFVADKTQKGWVMQGWAVNRVSAPGGRWVYTLYANPGGYPFVHALDTVRGVAHCIGLPWTASDQSPVFNFQLALESSSLAVKWSDGRVWKHIDTRSWHVSK
jgi:hypothetical protein